MRERWRRECRDKSKGGVKRAYNRGADWFAVNVAQPYVDVWGSRGALPLELLPFVKSGTKGFANKKRYWAGVGVVMAGFALGQSRFFGGGARRASLKELVDSPHATGDFVWDAVSGLKSVVATPILAGALYSPELSGIYAGGTIARSAFSGC